MFEKRGNKVKRLNHLCSIPSYWKQTHYCFKQNETISRTEGLCVIWASGTQTAAGCNNPNWMAQQCFLRGVLRQMAFHRATKREQRPKYRIVVNRTLSLWALRCGVALHSLINKYTEIVVASLTDEVFNVRHATICRTSTFHWHWPQR